MKFKDVKINESFVYRGMKYTKMSHNLVDWKSCEFGRTITAFDNINATVNIKLDNKSSLTFHDLKIGDYFSYLNDGFNIIYKKVSKYTAERNLSFNIHSHSKVIQKHNNLTRKESPMKKEDFAGKYAVVRASSSRYNFTNLHPNEEEAVNEAKRLANFEKDMFVVFKAVKSVTLPVPDAEVSDL